ncbi:MULTISPECIES: winged helix-turn-helix transcriptional regulator [unclassified Streptomyces]|jgi:DNA-binding HxlR family transcriptional regulator|uniref:winged helix-turn-helix transcriptional regulator n=1 Tax=unclassified Streptomyces TaxID=2593676 RepID=UPI003452C165
MAIGRRPGAYQCGVDAAMDVIGGKWKVLILWALGQRAHRFGELRRAVPGVTEKVLASHLRELEADGIVHREEFDEVPPCVEYSLTARGEALNAALVPLGAWGKEHVLGEGSATASGEVGEDDHVALVAGRAGVAAAAGDHA